MGNKSSTYQCTFITLVVLFTSVFLCPPHRIEAQCVPYSLPYYEDFDNLTWTFFSTLQPMVEDNCWRSSMNDHLGPIALNMSIAVYPDSMPGNVIHCGSMCQSLPGMYQVNGFVTLLVAPQLEEKPVSVSFSIFSYGIYQSGYLGDSLLRRLAVGFIADTSDWKGSFVGVDTIELTADRCVWERFTVTGFDSMPPPYFLAFFNDTLLQYPKYSLPQHHRVADYRFYLDSVLIVGREPLLLYDTTCQFSSYDRNGFILSVSETAIVGDTVLVRHLNDSTVKLFLTILPIITTEFEAVPDVALLKESALIQFFNRTDVSDIGVSPCLWVWDYGDGFSETTSTYHSQHQYTECGHYEVTLTLQSYPCIVSSSVTVSLEPNLEIPNVITPNGDGINDIFVIGNLNPNLSNELVISDRWGRIVFRKRNYTARMKDGELFDLSDGFSAENLSDGVYYYLFNYETVSRTIHFNGSITVIR